jgi:hypothetical protein
MTADCRARPSAPARKAYPLSEAARLLGVDPRIIKRAAAEGEFTMGRLGRRLMVPASWLERYDPQGSAA